MDSMRNLNTSLPSAPRRKRAKQPDVHQSFRSAALTVTNLYKAALADIDNSRVEGYQDALEDLIDFLDRENLGVGDGEGWRVRQWATERFDNAHQRAQATSDSDEDGQEERRARSSSPAMDRAHSPEASRTEPPQDATTNIRSDSAPPAQSEVQTMAVDPATSTPRSMFTFQSPLTYPTSNSGTGMTNNETPTANRRSEFSSPRRSTNRSSGRIRPASQNSLNLGNGAGQKRKFPLNEFFNVDNIGDRRDGSGGGGKRGRLA